MVNTRAVASVGATLSAVVGSLGGYNPFPYDPGFDIRKVVEQAIALPSHSWEYGTAIQAQLELFTPDVSVFGRRPFPVPRLDKDKVPALAYLVSKHKRFGTGYDAIEDGDGAAGDPASMAVGATMLGKTNASWAEAAYQTYKGLMFDVPRYSNGAISHRFSVPELWADFIYMAPTFLAYYAVDTENLDLLKEVVNQCGYYREILQEPAPIPANIQGVWRHIIGPQSQDVGLWSTGNAWAAGGMTRIIATIDKAPARFVKSEAWRKSATDILTGYIKEIVDGAINAPMDDGLLRNYLNDTTTGRGFGEVSGSGLIAAVIYRMTVMRPAAFADPKYLAFAEGIRHTLGGVDRDGKPHVTDTGIVTPAVNPLGWHDTKPFTTGSPEGNAFAVLLYTGWKDCVKARKCPLTGRDGKKIEVVDEVDVDVDLTLDAKRDVVSEGLVAHRRHLSHGVY